jgi:bacterioferritin-associated ferredoxin
MYICLCDDVKMHEIEMHISSGIKSPEEIFDKMNIATGCGSCKDMILGIVSDKII